MKNSWTYKRKIKTPPEANDDGCVSPPTKALPMTASDNS